MTRAALIVGLAFAAACFSPKIDSCAFRCSKGCPGDQICRPDGFCHAADDLHMCSGGGGIDAAVGGGADADLTIDARPRIDGSVMFDAPVTIFDARPPVDSRPPIDASLQSDAAGMVFDARPPVDAPANNPIDAGPPDARDCSTLCVGERTCGTVSGSGCECGGCEGGTWCGNNCDFQVCDQVANLCCLPDGSPCDVGLGQCCAGLTCLIAVCGTL